MPAPAALFNLAAKSSTAERRRTFIYTAIFIAFIKVSDARLMHVCPSDYFLFKRMPRRNEKKREARGQCRDT